MTPITTPSALSATLARLDQEAVALDARSAGGTGDVAFRILERLGGGGAAAASGAE